MAALPILAVTLLPERGVSTAGPYCLICGTRGGADAALNLLLFVPLGLALGRRWVPEAAGRAPAPRLGRWAALAGTAGVACLLSLGVEAVQLFLPGRDASLGDLLFNTAGGALGGGIWLWSDAWLRAEGLRAAILCLAAGTTAAAVVAATAFALGPSLPRTDYWGQWAPDLGHLERYEGRVLEASVGGLAVPVGRSARSEALRGLLLRGAPVEATALAGPLTAGVAPVFSLYDEGQREIALLGVDGRDVVWRVRRRAADLRLDAPDVRLRGGVAGSSPGDTLRLASFVESGRRCLAAGRERGACGVGPRLTDGWALLYFSGALGPAARAGLGAAWVAALLVPVGYWVRLRSACALALAAPLAALWLLPAAAAVEATPTWGYAAALAGAAAGSILALRVRRGGGARRGRRS